MAQLIFSQAKSIRRKAKNAKKLYDDIDPEFATRCYNSIVENEREEFREILKIAQLLHEDYSGIVGTTSNWYFLTVRPKNNTDLIEFTEILEKFINRSFVIEYTLTLEQKDPEGSGSGFHAHIVCNTKHRSKGELLRDTKSTFNKICEPQCIEIITTRNPKDIINNYLIEYKSKDDHKIITQKGDHIWRKKNNILPLYTSNENEFKALSIKSVKTVQNSVAPFILELV